MSVSEANPLPGSELAAFVAAVECGTIQGAADALSLTQSAATKRIQHLENRAGTRLLVREHHGVTPTPAGRRLYPVAKQALAALAEAGAMLAPGPEQGELRLASSLTIAEFLLPGWLSAFRAQAPGIRPQLEVVNSPAALRAVQEGRSDLAFLEGLDPLGGLEVLTVDRDQLVVVVAADHRWAGRGRVTPRQLSQEPYLTRERLSGTRAVAEAALAGAGVTLVPAMSAASLQSLKRAIRDGGFTIISARAVEAEVREGSLSTLAVSGVDLSRDLVAVRRRRGPHPEPARAFWRWLSRAAGELAESRRTPGGAERQ